MITSKYKKNKKIIGSIGIIGPIRMPYPKIISLVNYTAKLITKILNQEKENYE